MVKIGVVSIHTPHHQVSTWKANVVADALSHSQCTTAGDSTVELAKNNPDNEVYALTSVTIEPSEEDLKIWHQVYLEDLSTKTVFQQLC